MPRRVYQSFHYARDAHRVAQIRKMGAIEGQPLLSANRWEDVARGGERAIRRWIHKEMKGKSCLLVLIGTSTSRRKWVDYEIERGWKQGLGVLGVHIYGLKNLQGEQSRKGSNPFAKFTVDFGRRSLGDIVPVQDPPYVRSKSVYNYIAENLDTWIEDAITIRRRYPR
jgi:hypothetical protein